MGDQHGATVHFEVLGPLRASRSDGASRADGGSRADAVLVLGPLQQQVVLAVLLLNANRPVGREYLIDAVWGPSAPAYAVNLVQKHVSALRRVLEPTRSPRDQSRVLSWTDAGYVLSVLPADLDLAVFDGELARARVARAAGDLAGAAAALHTAIRLCRGPAFDGLTSPLLDAERERLAERRLTAVEERIEVDLALGRHHDLVGELRRLVADHPLRERLRGLLMLALYRSERQAEALAAFQDTRRQLRDELGVEPAAPLQRLHQQILGADPALEAAAVPLETPAVPQAASAAPPAQLPPAVRDFAGRDAELRRLDELVADGTGNAVLITAIAGTAGVGKTALAVHWAHRIRDRFPDGQLYVNLRGFDPSGSLMDPAEAIRGFLDALGVPPHRIPVSLDGQTALYRSQLADRRMLVVLDNAATSGQVRPLLPASAGCLALVTSRNDLAGLVAADGAHPVPLDLLTESEAWRLLTRRLGEQRVRAEPRAAEDIIALCARLPLALAIVAARAATHPAFPLAALATELRAARGRLDAFAGEDPATDVRAVFSWSYQRLSRGASRLFRLLGLYPGPDLSLPAAASLAGAPLPLVRPLFADLTSARLVEEHEPGRFAFHDLLRAYATEQVHAQDSDAEQGRATQRILDYYLHTAHAAAMLLEPVRDPIALPPALAGVTPGELTDRRHALAWFTAEHPVLLAAVELAAASALDDRAARLAWTLSTFFARQGHWRDWVAVQRAALTAAQRLGDRHSEAQAHRLLGRACSQLGDLPVADLNLRRALAIFGELDDRTGQAHTHMNLVVLLERQRRFPEALDSAQRALALYRATGHLDGQANALNAVGWYLALLGDYEQALSYCRQSLDLHRTLNDLQGQAATWDSIGYSQHQLGQYREAIHCYETATALNEQLGDRFHEADTLVRLGESHRAAHEVPSAREAWNRALEIFDQLDEADADRVRGLLKDLERDEHPPATGADMP